MIKIKFTRGSAYIEVVIDKRTVTFITPLFNFVPLKIDLDKLEEQKKKIKQMRLDKKILQDLAKLQTEEDMKKDVIDDLTKSGWEVREIGFY